MVGPLPKKPSGNDAESRFHIENHEAIYNRSRLMDVQGQAISRTTKGMTVIATGLARPAPQQLVQGPFKIQSMADDYLVCRAWDIENMTLGDQDVFIAKEYNTCTSLELQVLLGVEQTFTYQEGDDTLNLIRTATDEDGSEDQVIVPPWNGDEWIYASEADTGVWTEEGDPELVTLLIFGRSAVWAVKNE
jgi:hypothetical protein